MNEVKHTPGPWWSEGEYDEDERGCAIIAANTDCGPLPGNPTRGMVAWASELLPERADECIANARLIAAAPELLEALAACEKQAEEVRLILINHLNEPERTAFWKAINIRDLARAAISKATGLAP